MRLDKMLSNLKYGSRKVCQDYIKKGLVLVNNKLCLKPDTHVCEDDVISFMSEHIKYIPKFILMLNKPKGYLSSTKDENYPSVLNLIKKPYDRYDLKIIGRLDVDTTGLLLITNLGEYVHKIASPNYSIKKTYEVLLKEDISKDKLDLLLKPHILKDSNNKDYVSIANDVLYLDSKRVRLTITTGKYHQVKNMFKYLNNEVVSLNRLSIGNLFLPDNLKEGEYSEVKIEDIF